MKSQLLSLTGIICLALSFQIQAQNDLTNDELLSLLEEKRSQIAILEEENASLRAQLVELEATIADYKARIDVLDQQIENFEVSFTDEDIDNS